MPPSPPPPDYEDADSQLDRFAFANWLIEDARLGRISIEEIAVLAGKSSDPQFRALCDHLARLEHRRGLTLLFAAAGKPPRHPLLPIAAEGPLVPDPRALVLACAIADATRPVGWWGRMYRRLWATWKIWFPGR